MFYDKLQYWCKLKGTTPTTVVKQCGLSPGNLANWKRGVTPKVEILQKLASRLGVNMHDLLDDAPGEETGERLVNGDEELTAYLEELATRPEMRMLFSVAKGATKADVEKAVRIIEALRQQEDGEG